MLDFFIKLNPLYYIFVLFVLVLILIVVNISLAAKLSRVMKKYDRFMKGKNAEDLDGLMRDMLDKMDKIEKLHQKSKIQVQEGINSIGSTYKKMGLVKYDAFKEMGGNLSFALALLNSDNNGFIINTMHGRESSYTYAKEIVNGQAFSTLGEEEKEALDKAMKS